ncbi:MAG: electron transfer flavoprotein-ubiquinone oxidoreductase, partial [Gammaproteobacteria bacterium]|nr:electron transfer flavoprotein-ubiquinone oxidoreductase [Gammaproteobacteria bacterium]
MSTRERMEFDVIIVGGGPCGLSASIRLAQLGRKAGRELNICLLEKGAEIGAHIVSGAVLETRALDELLPGWRDQGAPPATPVSSDDFHFLLSPRRALKLPGLFIPHPMRNHGNFIVSLGTLCRWLGEQAENLGVNVFPGYPASEVLYGNGRVAGVATGDMGRARDGAEKPGYEAGIELRAPYTIFAEGCRGSLGKELMARFDLRKDCDPQHYGIGIKEIWRAPEERRKPGAVVHTLGWPLSQTTEGGGFLYHAHDGLIYLGFIVALNYSNPYLDPFAEFQRWKHHPQIRNVIEGGERISWGARAVNKGGLQSLPKLAFPGGVLAGCEAGFLNGAKIKGNHPAMKTGMQAAEAVFEALTGDEPPAVLASYEKAVRGSWVHKELWRARNFGPAQHRFGLLGGSAFTWLDQNVFRGRLPFTLHNREPDHAALRAASNSRRIDYPKPDGKLSFDRLSSVYLSATNHEEDQPCHLTLADVEIPIRENLPRFDEPAQRYCPAAVYEVTREGGEPRFVINAPNCIHCKTCALKDP